MLRQRRRLEGTLEARGSEDGASYSDEESLESDDEDDEFFRMHLLRNALRLEDEKWKPDLPALTCSSLDLSHHGFEELDENVKRLVNLRALHLNGNRLTDIPIWTSEAFTRLQVLKLRRNVLREVPQAIKNFEHLAVLDLGENMIREIPSWLEHLEELEVLYVDCNRLRGLPKELGSLTKLRKLDASFNSIRFVGGWLAKCSATMQELYLDSNRLEHFPDVVLKLKRLVHIGLSYNSIPALPDKIDNMRLLESLDVQANGLRSLPHSIQWLGKLRKLLCFDNAMKNFPDMLRKMSSLEVVEICAGDVAVVGSRGTYDYVPPDEALNAALLPRKRFPQSVRQMDESVYSRGDARWQFWVWIRRS